MVSPGLSTIDNIRHPELARVRVWMSMAPPMQVPSSTCSRPSLRACPSRKQCYPNNCPRIALLATVLGSTSFRYQFAAHATISLYNSLDNLATIVSHCSLLNDLFNTLDIRKPGTLYTLPNGPCEVDVLEDVTTLDEINETATTRTVLLVLPEEKDGRFLPVDGG